MQPLEKTLRNKLEKTIRDARDIAENAARAALEQLGVGEPIAYPHLTEDDRKLRRKLRAHGRQLGNGCDAKGRQELDRLIEEVAYEHWHRMLFARFLAENNLLMYPDPDDPVAVTLEECEDLAADEGAANGWELAARFAARMLPQIFRPDSPVFQLELPPEHQQKLEGYVAELPQQVFTASDSLGWVYQFWQAKKKDEINASGVKIGARELPAMTQLFTEPYMVSFLLDNSLGAWWATKTLSEADLRTTKTEDELRQKAAIPGVPLEHLRFIKQASGTWNIAAGKYETWPKQLRKLKIIDPCCGSGHFLVAVMNMLVPMRMESEALSASEALDAVLKENINGLEIDQRCVELAAFALAFNAWRYPNAKGYRQLPQINVACSGLTISVKKEEWLALAGDNTILKIALEDLYGQFKDGPTLGSLINLELDLSKVSLFELKWEKIGPLLIKALSYEKDDEKAEMGIVAQGLAKTGLLLSNKYNWVITNVPYLGRRRQTKRLMNYCERNYPNSKADLSTVFIERCLQLSLSGGVSCLVLPQNWLFLASYKKFRKTLLKQEEWNAIARLGAGAFETISGEVVKAILFILTKGIGKQEYETHKLSSIDVSTLKTHDKKSVGLKNDKLKMISQKGQLENPDARVLLEDENRGTLLGEYAETGTGLQTFDRPRFVQKFWETNKIEDGWLPLQSTPVRGSYFSGMTEIVKWQNGTGELFQFMQDKDKYEGYKSGVWRAGSQFWGKTGILQGVMSELPCSLYLGYPYDLNGAVLISKNSEHTSAIWSFSVSGEFANEVRKLDQKMMVTNSTFLKVPFDIKHWSTIAKEQYPNGLPKPFTNEPNQWIFHGYLVQSDQPLQVAVARLLGYCWPAESDTEMELSDESRAWLKKSQKLLPFADEDGIVCIPAVRGEMKAEDRLENLLVAAYGSEWSSNKKAELLAQADHAGKTLDTWLRDMFFTQHCKLFHHRPFIWHIWDGLRDGFAALVNYHKLDAKLLETLIYTYLGDWISRQKQDIGNGVDGAQERLAAAEALKKKLELILKGEAPYDIFVRWKPIEKQPIGWNPDLNDGARLNIRPFLTVPEVGKKGAGVLRDKPNIKWDKDRGKDVVSAPWYHLGPEYGGKEGDRINDHHLTLEEKRKARE